MRVGAVLGVLLIALGAWAVSGNATYKTKRNVFQVGEVKATVQEERAVPGWVGYLAIGGGVLVLLGAIRRRSQAR